MRIVVSELTRAKWGYRTYNFLSDNIGIMSQAFIREGDYQSLSDIAPTMNALINLLTMENGGIRVYEKKTITHPDGKIVHQMSNGLSYSKSAEGRWEVTS